ncbi:MAG TPA: hypothetical protein VN803_01795 [Gemmatimonadales bacterium]|nr:hypothetical protein [Gemmatimonadales bacterium]
MLSGFTIVRNAIKLDFPIVPAIKSVLEVCDEVVVNVGRSEDDTRDLVASVRDPRVRIIDTEWDFTKKNIMLSIETQRAMDACRGQWGIYIQADEVLHERGAHLLKEKVAEWDADPRVEGLLVKYLHFYGGFDQIATSRRWYRREVRCVRLGKDIRPYQGAQGFRVGPDYRKIQARVTGAEMFHYGWARPAKAIKEKLEISKTIYPWAKERVERDIQARGGALEWIPLLKTFHGAHPAAAREWIAARAVDPERVIGPMKLKPEHVRFYISDWIERLTGARVFEFRNYVLI